MNEISQYILDFFRERGIKSYRTEVAPGRFNVFAVLEGTDRENSPSLMLTGHMDTVPAYDFEDAFSGRIAEESDGRKYVYGRGSSDKKGPLASMMCAMAAIKDSGIILGPGELALAHSIHEKVSVDELETAARIYAEMAVDYCRV